jgi:hypothetical protein
MIRRRVGGWCWIAVGLLVVAELIAATAWNGLGSDRFDPLRIAISDLGATGCAVPDSPYENCSPLYPLLDLTLIAVGLMIIVGAVLDGFDGLSRWPILVARGLLVSTGVLVVLQGVVPPWNAYGAESVALVGGTTVGAVALTLLGYVHRPTASSRRYLRVLGLVGLVVGLVLIGLIIADPPRVLSRVGGILERLAVYPVLAGLILLGAERLRRAGKPLAPAGPAA